MRRRGLLYRLAHDGHPLDEVTSILEHVHALLNTRRGATPCAPTLGVADLADVVHAFPGGLEQLASSIRSTLLEHEPRLRAVAVRRIPADGELVLRFEITAQLGSTPGRALKMTSTVRPGGRVDVLA